MPPRNTPTGRAGVAPAGPNPHGTAPESAGRATPSSLTRRRLLTGGAGLLGAGALASLAACGTPSASGATQQNLSFWHLLSGPDGVTMGSLVDGFNGSQDVASLTQTVLAWGSPYYTKLAMASAGGRAPDVAIMHAARVPGYAPGGLLDSWDMDLFAELGIREEDFPERIWAKSLHDGELTAVCLDSHPFVLYYNTEIAEAAGALGSDGLLEEATTPEQFRDLAARLGDASDGGHGLAFGYLGDGSNMWRMFSTYYTQMGGTVELPIGGTMQYDEGLAVDTLEWILSLIDGDIGNASHDGGTAISEFITGKAGMFYGGVWETGNYKAQGVPFDISLVPNVFGTPAAYADSHAFVLPHQTNPDPERRRLVHEFVAYVLKNSLDWAAAGHIPAYSPVVDDPAYDDLVPQSHYADATDYLVYDPEAWFSGSGSDFHRYFGDHMQNVFMRTVPPIDGLNGFVERINALLAKPSPV
ncbi:extracellular solute-binding protein family 1 [Beutenbergia cavernae DSM 12333]|uniref:Extracellular solute-binding protein family 1 n=1 Tax=Beutenbergia cavernae (strain ATCC BAA-8 / DSM 12333 / CCUG 43141 / JCM 11478 / NBRC 16432 / NCIMB 13614 / HKI 0122) TaxID=471853 RepID=C5BUQ7_BEUC1|nr:extracellular solute-binding protein [Beutenbergia cavernae]ACQ78281.1 extracellular solute-binding protein family 1 [Beutenbergia cavernae DSM 12333]